MPESPELAIKAEVKMKKTILILSAVLLVLACAVGTTADSYAAEDVSGVYLLGTTTIAGNSSKLYFSMNFYSSGTVGRSCVCVYDVKSDGLTDTGTTIDFGGKIKKIRYGMNCLFVHIGDTLYYVDLKPADPVGRAVLLQKELLTFDADEHFVYCVFQSESGSLIYSKTPLSAFSDQSYTIPYKGSLLPFVQIGDLHADNGKIYFLGEEGKLLIRDVDTDSDVVKTPEDFGLSEGVLPEKVVSFGGNAYIVIGNKLIEVSSQLETIVLAGSDNIKVGDSAVVNGRIFILDSNEREGAKDIKEYLFFNGKPEFLRVALSNKTVTRELPDFKESTFDNAVSKGKYELVYALSYPSNVVYACSGKEGVYLEAQLLSPDQPVLILNYDTAKDFYLIAYNGKLGNIVKNDATLSVAHDRFREVRLNDEDRYRRGLNQTLTVFSVPSSGNGNVFGKDYSITDGNNILVQVLYELQGFDSEGVKWVYAYYRDEDGVSRYCFILSGDLTDVKKGEVVYTVMKASPDFGQKLRVYESDSALSDEVTSLPSGTLVNVYERVETSEGAMCFIKAEVNGTTCSGYVFANKLVEKGKLCSNEKIAIGLISISLLLIAGIIVLIKIAVKKRRKAPVTNGGSLSEKPAKKTADSADNNANSDDMGF